MDWIATTSHDADLLRRGGRGQDPKPVYDDAYKAWRDYVVPGSIRKHLTM
jgi:hypothetical protein